MAENLRFVGKVTGARITKTADWWGVRIQVDLPDALPETKQAALGIDVGLNRLVTLSSGEGVENQAFLKTALKKLRRANKRLHRRKLGSKNREKARRQVARLHYRITCLRDDVLHKLTTQLASSCGIIGIEDLNRKRAPQESQARSRLFGCCLRQIIDSVDQQGRATRRAGDQGRPLLCFQ